MGLIGKIMVRLGLDNSEYTSKLKQSEAEGNKFTSAIKKMGAAMLAAFSVQMITRFIGQASKMAATFAGVEKAFNRLADQSFLQRLRDATQGMVTDLDLMKNTVAASNFRIPLENLASYFRFATVRAAETGESVDYLVSSIITGLGRKSVMILDNLGFSAAEIREEMAKGGDMAAAIGKIIEKSMKDGGGAISETAKQTANLATEWSNFTVVVGTGINNLITPALKSLNGYIDTSKKVTSSKSLSWWDKVVYFLGGFGKAQGVIADEQRFLNQQTEKYNKLIDEIMVGVTSQKDAEYQLAVLRAHYGEKEMSLFNKMLKGRLESYLKTKQQTVEEEGLLSVVKNQITVLEERAALETDPLRLRILNDEIASMNERLKVLQMTTKEYRKYIEEQNKSRTPLGLPQVTQSITTGVVSQNDPFKGGAYGYLTAQGENIANQVKAQNDKLEQEKARAEQIAQGFQNAFVNILGNSIEQLTSIIAGTEKLNTGQVVATLLMPLADMAITAGGIILTTGTAIESLKASLVAFFGGSAIAAGAALIAVGAAAKIGLKALATGGTKSAGSTTTFTGGSAPIQFKPMESVELYSVIKGSDIYLTSKKYEQNRNR